MLKELRKYYANANVNAGDCWRERVKNVERLKSINSGCYERVECKDCKNVHDVYIWFK